MNFFTGLGLIWNIIGRRLLKEKLRSEMMYHQIFAPHVELISRYYNAKFDAIDVIDFTGFDMEKFSKINPAEDELINAITASDSKFRFKNPYNLLIKEWDNLNSQSISPSVAEQKKKIKDKIITQYAKDLLEVVEYIEHISDDEKERLTHYLGVIREQAKKIEE